MPPPKAYRTIKHIQFVKHIQVNRDTVNPVRRLTQSSPPLPLSATPGVTILGLKVFLGVHEMAKTTASPKSKKSAAEDNKKIEQRWGKDLTAAGWTAIPNVLFECSQQLKLKHLDIVIILHLAGYWWHAGNDPYPTKQTLAAKIGVEPRTIQRAIAALEEKGYITRKARTSKLGGNLSNSYSFEGIIEAAKPFAQAMVAARDGKANQKAAPAPLKLVE